MTTGSGGEVFNIVLTWIVDIETVVSLLCALMTIVSFVVFKDYRNFSIRMVIWLCASIFFAQAFFIASFFLYNTELCIPGAYIYHFFFLADFMWTLCVGINFYQMLVKRNPEAYKYEKFYHLACWLIPGALVAAVGASGKYGKLPSGWCYINSQVALFGTFFLPGLIVVSVNTVLFYIVSREIRVTMKSSPRAETQDKSREIKIYFSLFASLGVSWIFGFIMFVFPQNNYGRLVFLVLFSITTPLQGVFIFVAYCLNAKMAGKWAGLIGRCIPFFRRWENIGTSTKLTNTGSGRTN